MSAEPIIAFEPLREAIMAELTRREIDFHRYCHFLEDRFGWKAGTFERKWTEARVRGWMGLHRADMYLTCLGLHLYDLRGWTWETEPEMRAHVKRGPEAYFRHPPEKVEAGMALLRQGVGVRPAARELGLPRGTVVRWKKKLEAQENLDDRLVDAAA